LLSFFAADVNDTGGKFTAGVIDGLQQIFSVCFRTIMFVAKDAKVTGSGGKREEMMRKGKGKRRGEGRYNQGGVTRVLDRGISEK
jgi:hypothetical protein